MKIKKQVQILVASIFVILMACGTVYAQETEVKRTSVTTGIGFGFNDGQREMGNGFVYSVGWQKSFGEKNKLRINPNVVFGGFSTFGYSDVSDQYYKLTLLGINAHYDLLKYKAVSIVAIAGGFVSLSRGLRRTVGSVNLGWASGTTSSGYFYSSYVGGNISAALRIAPAKRRYSFEIRPLNIYAGNNGFMLISNLVVMDFKLQK